MASAETLRRASLESARVRRRRSELKAQIKSGELTVRAALDLPEFQKVAVAEVLAARSGWGERRVARAFVRTRIHERALVSALTVRQKDLIVHSARL